MKNMMRAVGRTSFSVGKGKEQRVKQAARNYLSKARALLDKLEGSKETFPVINGTDLIIMIELERFMELMDKYIDLLDRRVLKGEYIPHEEKIFSIFVEYTECLIPCKKLEL